MESAKDKFFDDLIDVSTYNNMKGRTQTSINDLKAELKEDDIPMV